MFWPLAECEAASRWWADHLETEMIDARKILMFMQYLCWQITNRISGHWYPSNPNRGSGYRSIMNDLKVDPLLLSAARYAEIEDIGKKLPRAVMFVNPGIVKIHIYDRPGHSTIYEGPALSFSVLFPIWIEFSGYTDPNKVQLESMFGPLCSFSRHGVPPVVRGIWAQSTGAFVSFLHFEHANAALEGGGGQSRARVHAVGNTLYVRNMLEMLSRQPEIDFGAAERLYESIPHVQANHWLDVLLRCAPRFDVRDEWHAIQLRSKPGPSAVPPFPAGSLSAPAAIKFGLFAGPPPPFGAADAPRVCEEEASRAATPHQCATGTPSAVLPSKEEA